jgi:2-keto-4-pentenoate hydratase/2-oxohepta-3-ene-1,7-dioic acid hydratase in catechol pathway
MKGVRFNLPRGLVTASALFGSHIEEIHDFKEYQESGDISTLSFHFEYDDNLHSVQVTPYGAIILQNAYKEISYEIEIVLNIKKVLLDGIFIDKRVKKKSLK